MVSAGSVKIAYVGVDDPVYRILSDRMAAIGWELVRLDPASRIESELARTEPALVLYNPIAGSANRLGVFGEIRGSSSPTVASVPIILLSENGDLVEIGEAIKYGIADYIVKRKFDIELAISKIGHHLENALPSGVSTAGFVAEEGPLEAQEEKKVKLLIVEDDKFLRDLAVQKLSNEGLSVFPAVDGEQGVAIAEKELPEIILLDILLPGIDGYEVLRRVRSNPTLNATRIAMLSNFGQREDIEKALNAGAEQFFVKANYTLDEIVSEVKTMLAKRN